MTTPSNHSSGFSQPDDHQTIAEIDLLNAISHGDNIYPWEPAAQTTEFYFDNLATISDLTASLSEQELNERSHQFFQQLEQTYTLISVEQSVLTKFAPFAPENILKKLSSVASEVVSQVARVSGNLSLSDQLVHCVNEILPQWSLEDLEVLARPYAYAMRSSNNDMIQSTVQSLNDSSWENLSDLEQVRLSLAIALYAINTANQ
jgi:hypothetical protein